MLKLEIDCPFEIGEYVEFTKERSNFKFVDCPFCHGKKYYNFETEEFGDYEYLERKMTKKMPDDSTIKRTPQIVKCRNCSADGKIGYTSGYEVKFFRGTIKRVQSLHSSGWRTYEFIIEEENSGKDVVVIGSELRKVNKEETIF